MRIYLAIIFIFVALHFVNSQSSSLEQTDASKIEVSKLNDAQVTRIIKEMDSRGLTEADAVNLARAKGMSEQQILELRTRILEVKNGSNNDQQSGNNKDQLSGDYNEYSNLDTTKNSKSDISKKLKDKLSLEDKRIFGLELFSNKNISFQPSFTMPVSSDYLIGFGDEIVAEVWGNSQQSYRSKVDLNGNISIPNVGLIHVGSLYFGAVQQIITNRLTTIYRDLSSGNPQTFVSVSLGKIRSIKVSIIGEVYAPGSYTLPGTASAFNALYLSGGPTRNGSLRNIKVIRAGVVVDTLDVYDFLINGNTKQNPGLTDGDLLLVSTFSQRVRVGGQLQRQKIFEMKESETVADLIKFAGGFTELAYKYRIELFRINGRQREFKDVEDKEFAGIKLANGDSLYVDSIINRYTNRIQLVGAVQRPGFYQLKDSMTLAQLIARAEGFREDVFWDRGLITRMNPDFTLDNLSFDPKEVLKGQPIILKKDDVVRLYSIHDLQEAKILEVYGEVQKPGKLVYQSNLKLSDVITLSGGFLERGSELAIEVSRRPNYSEISKVTDVISQTFQFNVSRDLALSKDATDFELKPFDKIFIRKAPGFHDAGEVTLMGEVVYAGTYSLSSRQERISDFIKRTGGLTPSSYPNGAMLTRVIQESQKVLRLRKELAKKDSTLNSTDLDFEIVGIDLASILKNPGSKQDIFLKDGDELVIPRELQTVKISGEVMSPISATYEKDKRIGYYLDQAGGKTALGVRGKAYVVYPNGTAARTRGFIFKRSPMVYAGSQIIVPAKRFKEPLTAAAWIGIGSGLASIAIAFATLANLYK